jgi:hypothetical protein
VRVTAIPASLKIIGKLNHNVVSRTCCSRDNDLIDGFRRTQSINNPFQNGATKQISHNLAWQAGRGHAGLHNGYSVHLPPRQTNSSTVFPNCLFCPSFKQEPGQIIPAVTSAQEALTDQTERRMTFLVEVPVVPPEERAINATVVNLFRT